MTRSKIIMWAGRVLGTLIVGFGALIVAAWNFPQFSVNLMHLIWQLASKPSITGPNDPQCANVTITGEKFLSMYYDIAMHGDLMDLPFIEKTLQTKFAVKYSDQDTGYGRHYWGGNYSSDNYLGMPIRIYWSFTVELNSGIENHSSARIDFAGNFKCLGITKKAFDAKFGGDPIKGFTFHGPSTHETWSKDLLEISKDGMRIHTAYSTLSNEEDNFIYEPMILQTKNKKPSP